MRRYFIKWKFFLLRSVVGSVFCKSAGTRLWNSVDAKWLWRILQSSCLISVFPNINGEHESTLTTSKKYLWCIPVQKEIKPIIWGAAITPEPWNRQQCWFIFEDPNVMVARLLESLATISQWWLRWRLGTKQATSHYLNQSPSLMMHRCVTSWPQWVNTLRPTQNGRHFADDTFKCVFLNENI